MYRGFKSQCEKKSAEIRRVLNLKKVDPLDPKILADHLKIQILPPYKIPGLSDQDIQNLLKDSDWSALTLDTGIDKFIIINPTHSQGRIASDLMHEIAHIIMGHKSTKPSIAKNNLLVPYTYDENQEKEADWLSGCLLLPKDALIKIKKSRMSIYTASKIYNVSQKMLKYRLNITGVNKIFR